MECVCSQLAYKNETGGDWKDWSSTALANGRERYRNQVQEWSGEAKQLRRALGRASLQGTVGHSTFPSLSFLINKM